MLRVKRMINTVQYKNGLVGDFDRVLPGIIT